MRIVSLSIENILSIEKADISFPDNGLLLVEGWNHDTNSANGAGKTSIFEALSWGLFGQFPRTASITEFVRIGSRESSVRVVCQTHRGALSIERRRPKYFHAELDGVELTEDEVLAILPITYQQFALAQYSSQGGGIRFLELNDSGRKDLILELMRADGFAEAKSKIDNEIKLKLSEVDRMSSEIRYFEAKISTYEEGLIDEKTCAADIDEITAAIDDVLPKIIKLETIQRPDAVDKHQEMLDKLSDKLQAISVNKGQLKTYRQMLKDLKPLEEPDDADGVCPCCDAELDLVDGVFMRHDRESIDIRNASRKEAYDAKRSRIIADINEMEKKIQKEDQILEAMSSIRSHIRSADQEFRSAQQRCSELRMFVKQKESERDNLYDIIKKQQAIKAKISTARRSVSDLSESKAKIQSDSELLQAGAAILSPTGVPAYVMDSVIQGINDRIQDIIQTVWPSSFYELQSFRETKSGKITTKMSDHFSIDGVKRSIGSLSGGERRCLSLAIDFAILDIVSRYTGADLNPLILDEPFDHLDAANRSRVIELLQEMALKRCIIVIDHAAEAKAMFDHSIRVVKRSGITTVS